MYTVGHKKRATLFSTISHVSWWLFTLLVSMERGMNALQRSYIIYNFATLGLPDKIKTYKTAHFEVICHGILLFNSKGESAR